MTTLIALWGAILSTILGALKVREEWRKRFRIGIVPYLTTDDKRGNEVIVRNLGSNPVILTYWELLWVSGQWPFWRKVPFRFPEEVVDIRIDVQSSHKLQFVEAEHFAWNPTALRGRKIYIHLWFAGRRRAAVRKVI